MLLFVLLDVFEILLFNDVFDVDGNEVLLVELAVPIERVDWKELIELIELVMLASLGQRDIPVMSLELHDDSDDVGDPR